MSYPPSTERPLTSRRITLVQVPQGDPTQVYLSLPRLKGALRDAGYHDVTTRDLNLDAYCWSLTAERIEEAGRLVSARLDQLDKRARLDKTQSEEYFALVRGKASIDRAAGGIDEALDTIRSRQAFYELDRYSDAISTIEGALRVLSAVVFPSRWRMFGFEHQSSMSSCACILDAIEAEGENPFVPFFNQVALPWIVSERPSLLGISIVYSSQLLPGLTLAKMVWSRYPDIRIVLGGPAIAELGRSMVPANEWLEFITAIVYAEGESAIVGLASAIDGGESALAAVPNILYRGGDRTRMSPMRIEDLASLALPDFSCTPFDRYLAPKPVVMLDVTRGCYWGKCAFCAYGVSPQTLKAYREMTLEQVVSTIKTLKELADTDAFMFSVDVLSPSFVRRLSEAFIEVKLDIRWMGDMRCERKIDQEFAQLMHRGGARFVSMGLETAVQRMMDHMDKGTREKDLSRILAAFRAADIGVNAQFFLGFPTETTGEARQTVSFVLEHQHQISTVGYGHFHLIRGSAVFDDPQPFGIKSMSSSEEVGLGHIYPFDVESGLTSAEAKALVEAVRPTLNQVFPTTGNASLLLGAHGLLMLSRFGADRFDSAARAVMIEAPTQDSVPLTRETRIELTPWTAHLSLFHDLFAIIGAERRRQGDQHSFQRGARPQPVLYDAEKHRCCRLTPEQDAVARLIRPGTTWRHLEKDAKAMSKERLILTIRQLERAGLVVLDPTPKSLHIGATTTRGGALTWQRATRRKSGREFTTGARSRV